jgi:FkbM family methyltransferase
MVRVYAMQILYGTLERNIDVTEKCFNQLVHGDIMTIPASEHCRSAHFTDPLYGVLKKIFIIIGGVITDYDHNQMIRVNVKTEIVNIITDAFVNDKLAIIHNGLRIFHGGFQDELPEQKMVVRYLTGSEKVLEIGSNIGRNSLIIGHILKEFGTNNFVTLESDSNISSQVKQNRDLNDMNFSIENSALSKRKLIQKGWDTIPSDVLLDGFTQVNTITMEDLNAKYGVAFDTLVLDCEGAFYYILQDMPEILSNIKLIIMENDYFDINKKRYVDDKLTQTGFIVHYVEGGGWGPCCNNFFEVWMKCCK